MPPLKNRIVNFDPKSLDEIVKRAIEEKQYVVVNRSSNERVSLSTSNSFPVRSQPQRFYNNSNFQYTQSQMRPSYYGLRNKQNAWNRNNFFHKDSSSAPHPNYNQTNNNVQNNSTSLQERPSESSLFCSRCNKSGHTANNCFPTSNPPPNYGDLTSNDLANRVKQISFLEVPRTRNQSQRPDNNKWTKRSNQ